MSKNSSAQEAFETLSADRSVVQMKGKVRIVGWEPAEDRGIETPVFSTQAEMRTFYANQIIKAAVPTADGGTKNVQMPLFDYWLKHPDRPSAIGVTMNNTGGRFVDGRLNLWRGYGVDPEFGDCSLIHRHILEVICAGNKENAAYLTRWIAWCLQHPTEPAEVVIVLRGRKGTGKGEFGRMLCRLFGSHALQISDRKHLVGSFNAHLLQVCLLFADEAFWPGDKASEGTLKRMITEPTLFVEPKGIDGFEVPNRLSIVMASNESWVVPATEGERRFAVFDVADIHAKDFEYFKALRKQINHRLGAFLDEMLSMDLGDWHPREDVPMTKGLADQQAESVPPLVDWLGQILEEGALPYATRDASGQVMRIVHKTEPALARPGLLLDAARARDKRIQHVTEIAFWNFLDQHGIAKADDRRDASGRFRRFPPLAGARRAFRDKYPFWPEFSNPSAKWRHDDREVHTGYSYEAQHPAE